MKYSKTEKKVLKGIDKAGRYAGKLGKGFDKGISSFGKPKKIKKNFDSNGLTF
jgi:hypothetical protein